MAVRGKMRGLCRSLLAFNYHEPSNVNQAPSNAQRSHQSLNSSCKRAQRQHRQGRAGWRPLSGGRPRPERLRQSQCQLGQRERYTAPSVLHLHWLDMLAAGAWLIHIVLILIGKIIVDNIPGMSQQISWTVVNLLYQAVCGHLNPL